MIDKSFDSEMKKDHRKKFLRAPRRSADDRYEPIVDYISKINEKQNFDILFNLLNILQNKNSEVYWKLKITTSSTLHTEITVTNYDINKEQQKNIKKTKNSSRIKRTQRTKRKQRT